MYNSTYNPASIAEFEKSKLNYAAEGCSIIVPAGTTADLDLQVTDDVLITGAWVISIGSEFGDTAKFQVVDHYGIYTGGVPDVVLSQFIKNWYLVGDVNINMDMQYPAKIYGGLFIRLKYTSVGATDVKLAANWKLHKILV